MANHYLQEYGVKQFQYPCDFFLFINLPMTVPNAEARTGVPFGATIYISLCQAAPARFPE
tara:strand:+ start:29 stop:208 length:180 start_codon:yes stop_codon:yes gene_type:complete